MTGSGFGFVRSILAIGWNILQRSKKGRTTPQLCDPGTWQFSSSEGLGIISNSHSNPKPSDSEFISFAFSIQLQFISTVSLISPQTFS